MFLMLFLFFFNDTATTEIYTLSLHDALPISVCPPGPIQLHRRHPADHAARARARPTSPGGEARDRKSTRLNSSHGYISYAVFCLKKKRRKIMNDGSTNTPVPSPKLTWQIHLF